MDSVYASVVGSTNRTAGQPQSLTAMSAVVRQNFKRHQFTKFCDNVHSKSNNDGDDERHYNNSSSSRSQRLAQKWLLNPFHTKGKKLTAR